MQTIIVRVISDYKNSTVQTWLKQQSEHGDCSYHTNDKKVFFTTENIECDYVLLINKVNCDTEVFCPKDNVWGLQQEPFIPANSQYCKPFKNEFAKKPSTYASCSKVLAFVKELLSHQDKFIPSPPFIYWLIEGGERKLTYQELLNLDITHKNEEISCIANLDKKAFAGHLQRAEFVRFLQKTSLPIKYFGGEKVHNTIPTKLEALQDFKYSIAIENSSTPYYFSEKITDCFMAGCMPIYYGAENIFDFFPEKSLIWIDIKQPNQAQKIIHNAIKEKLWEKNFDFILEAREKCFKDYNFVNAIGNQIAKDFKKSLPKEKFVIKGYKTPFYESCIKRLEHTWLYLKRPFISIQKANIENDTFNQ